MMRWLLVLVSAVLIGLVVHIVSLLAVPSLAPRDVYGRLSALGGENTPVMLETENPQKGLPYLDPAFVHLACRYDLSAGPVSVRVPLAAPYVSMSFHRRDGTAFFSLNDRSALGSVLDAELRDAADEAAKALPLGAGTISVNSPDPIGFVLIRAFAPWPSSLAGVRDGMAKTVCAPRT